MRQDPDIIMVGEIRDLDTAEIAIQAAFNRPFGFVYHSYEWFIWHDPALFIYGRKAIFISAGAKRDDRPALGA